MLLLPLPAVTVAADVFTDAACVVVPIFLAAIIAIVPTPFSLMWLS